MDLEPWRGFLGFILRALVSGGGPPLKSLEQMRDLTRVLGSEKPTMSKAAIEGWGEMGGFRTCSGLPALEAQSWKPCRGRGRGESMEEGRD